MHTCSHCVRSARFLCGAQDQADASPFTLPKYIGHGDETRDYMVLLNLHFQQKYLKVPNAQVSEGN